MSKDPILLPNEEEYVSKLVAFLEEDHVPKRRELNALKLRYNIPCYNAERLFLIALDRHSTLHPVDFREIWQAL